MSRIHWSILGLVSLAGCGGTSFPTYEFDSNVTGVDGGSADAGTDAGASEQSDAGDATQADACKPFATHATLTDDAGFHRLVCMVQPPDTAHSDCARTLLLCDESDAGRALPTSLSCTPYGCSNYWCCDSDKPDGAPVTIDIGDARYPSDAPDAEACQVIVDPSTIATCRIRDADASPGPACDKELIECDPGTKPSIDCTWYPCTNFWCCTSDR